VTEVNYLKSLSITRARLAFILLFFSFSDMTFAAPLARLRPPPEFARFQSRVYRRYPWGSLQVTCSLDVGQVLASGTQCLATHSYGFAPQYGSDLKKETAEKIADAILTIQVERGRIHRADPMRG